MKIFGNNLNSINIVKPAKTGQTPTFKTRPTENDCFVKSPNFTGSYSNAIQKANLKAEIDPVVQEIATECTNVSKIIKRHFDEKFGKGNWEFVSIGRSLAVFSEILEKMGVKSNTIPISNLSKGKGFTSIEDMTHQTGFKDYREYIYNLGLDPKNVKNSRKTYIFMDYKDGGGTIENFEKFIRSNEMGLDFDNVQFTSINQTCEECFPKSKSIDEARALIGIMPKLSSQNTPLSLKNYTKLPKLNWQNLDQIKSYPPKEKFIRDDLKEAIERTLESTKQD